MRFFIACVADLTFGIGTRLEPLSDVFKLTLILELETDVMVGLFWFAVFVNVMVMPSVSYKVDLISFGGEYFA